MPNYRDLGRTDLTAHILRRRYTAWTRHLMHKAIRNTGSGLPLGRKRGHERVILMDLAHLGRAAR
jgi:hypothetical protein